MKSRIVVAAIVFAGLTMSAGAIGQSAVKRTVLQRADIPTTAYEGVTGIAEIPPGLSLGKHTHPGVEIGYVLSGELVISVEGKEPLTVKAGDSYTISAGAIHDAENKTKDMARALATWMVEKGKPMSTPVTKP
jgi:quercetin dioxygenase-like cupin family protein